MGAVFDGILGRLRKKDNSGGGNGDMTKSIYDPIGGEKQVAFSDEVVKLTGNQTIDGFKTFNTTIKGTSLQATGSSGLLLKNNNGQSIIELGLAGLLNCSIKSTLIVGEIGGIPANARHQLEAGSTSIYHKVSGGTNVNIDMIPKGTGRLQENGVNIVNETVTQTLTNKTLTSPKINEIKEVTQGNPILSFSDTGVAVNSDTLNIEKNPSGSDDGSFRISPITDLTSADLYIEGKGTGNVNITNLVASPTVISGNTTAINGKVYTVTANATFTDPSPAEGKGYKVIVRNGTATIGGTGYSTAGTEINRIYHSGAWASYALTPGGGSSGSSVIYSGAVAGQQIKGQVCPEFPAGQAFTLAGFKISLEVLPAGANFLVDLKKNGTSVLSTTLSITTTESATNGIYTVTTGDSGKATISTSSFSANDRIKVEITQIGSTVSGYGFTWQMLI